MGQISLAIPTLGQPNATEDPKIVTDFTTLQTLLNGNLDDTNLSADSRILNLWRPFGVTGSLILTGATATTVASPVFNFGGLLAVTPTSKTLQARLHLLAGYNSLGLDGATLTGALCPVMFSGGAGSLVLTPGALVGTAAQIVTSGGEAFGTPFVVSPSFSAVYALTLGLNGAWPAGSRIGAYVMLDYRYV